MNALLYLMASVFVAIVWKYREYLVPRRSNLGDVVVYPVGHRRLARWFTDIPVPTVAARPENPHREAAAARSGFIKFAEMFSQQTGLEPYHVSMSQNQLATHGVRGSRPYHGIKDAVYDEYRVDERSPGSMSVLCDVDFHMDEHELYDLCDGPILMYTWCPIAPAGVSYEVAYQSRGSTWLFEAPDGAHYEHPLWDYNCDTVAIRGPCNTYYTAARIIAIATFATLSCASLAVVVLAIVEGRALGGIIAAVVCVTLLWVVTVAPHGPDTVVCAVRRRDDGHGRSIVFLLPLRKYTQTLNTTVDLAVESGVIKRLSCAARGPLQAMRTMAPQPGVSISHSGHAYAVFAPDSLLAAARSSARQTKGKIYAGTVAAIAQHLGITMNSSESLLVAEYVASDQPEPPLAGLSLRVPATFRIRDRSVQPGPTGPGMTQFMPPLVTPAAVPARCAENTEAMVAVRVRAPRGDVEGDTRVHASIARFVHSLPAGQVRLADALTILEHQSRQTQRTRNEQALISYFGGPANRNAKVNTKAEAVPLGGPPRPITTLEPEPSLRIQRVMYSLTAFAKEHFRAQYSFGMKPAQVAQRVADVAQACRIRGIPCRGTDFSKFDGSVSEALRHFEECLIAKVFHSDDVDEALAAHRECWGNRVSGPFGVKYEQGFARGSGLGDTSVLNTLDNLFVLYHAGAALELCVVGGDDGVVGCTDPALAAASNDLGLVMTVEPFTSHVKFLGRVYGPAVFFGDCNSMCDLTKTLAKFHYTTLTGVTAPEVLRLKLESFSWTDANTPVLSELMRAFGVHRNGSVAPEEASYLSRGHAYDVQYPNDFAGWMEDFFLADCPDAQAVLSWARGSTVGDLTTVPVYPPHGAAKYTCTIDGGVVLNAAELPSGTEANSDKATRERVMAADIKRASRARNRGVSSCALPPALLAKRAKERDMDQLMGDTCALPPAMVAKRLRDKAQAEKRRSGKMPVALGAPTPTEHVPMFRAKGPQRTPRGGLAPAKRGTRIAARADPPCDA